MTNETKQTAVERLKEQIMDSKYFYQIVRQIQNKGTIIKPNIFDEALAMEKDKMENLWHAAISHGGCKCYDPLMTFEQYYNETYGGNK